MRDDFQLQIIEWLAAPDADPIERETFSALRIVAPGGTVLTEVQDTLAANTVRQSINVPAGLLPEWFLVNWWRLRWEPRHEEGASLDWRRTHSMASIGDGYAWPDLSFSSDGEAIRVKLDADRSAKRSSIRYLRTAEADIRPAAFEMAIDTFVSTVEGRVAARLSSNHELSDLYAELRAERSNPSVAKECRLQAMAGFDPGAQPDGWTEVAIALEQSTGRSASQEILAVSPTLEQGLSEALDAVTAMRRSSVLVDLEWVADARGGYDGEVATQAPPWVRGTEAAKRLRGKLGIPEGPILNDALQDLLKVKLPLPTVAGTNLRLLGGYRQSAGGATSIVARHPHDVSQRFYLARLIGAATSAPHREHVLPVSRTFTAHQKLQRAFASEFLCPWEELRSFTDVHGTDSDGLEEAAQYFQVSPLLVHTTLVNKKVLARESLPARA